ncbi:hypothetical protein ACHAXS_005336 [Conticribra weissflogii]
MPPYPGMRHSIEVSGNSKLTEANDARGNNEIINADQADWAAQYEAYLIQKEEEIIKSNLDGITRDEVDDTLGDTATEDDWALQYAKYCEEKEEDFFETYKYSEG